MRLSVYTPIGISDAHAVDGANLRFSCCNQLAKIHFLVMWPRIHNQFSCILRSFRREASKEEVHIKRCRYGGEPFHCVLVRHTVIDLFSYSRHSLIVLLLRHGDLIKARHNLGACLLQRFRNGRDFRKIASYGKVPGIPPVRGHCKRKEGKKERSKEVSNK